MRIEIVKVEDSTWRVALVLPSGAERDARFYDTREDAINCAAAWWIVYPEAKLIQV